MSRLSYRAVCHFFAAVGLACLMGGASAEVKPLSMPGDPKLVVFPYDANNSFRILARPRAVTHIELAPDERVRILALGDTVSWQAVDKENNVFIKPTYPRQSAAGTLVTTKRTYQLLLVAGDEDDKFYQRVTFQYPDVIAREAADADRAMLAPEDLAAGNRADAAKSARGASAAAAPTLDAASLHFSFDIEGDAQFKPQQIYHDGRSTFIRFDSGVVDIPALFRLREGTALELVEYANRGNLLIVGRVLEAGLLKLGEHEVRFFNRDMLRTTFFGQLERTGSPYWN